MKKLKHEKELAKKAVQVGMAYAERRGAAQFDKSDSAHLKIEYVYRLLVHDKVIQPLAKGQENEANMKHKLAIWITKQLPADHPLLRS